MVISREYHYQGMSGHALIVNLIVNLICTVVSRIFEYDCAFACVSSVFQDELKSKF